MIQRAAPTRLLVAGTLPGDAAGNSVSTEVLRDALANVAPVDILSHAISVRPSLVRNDDMPDRTVVLGAQPIVVHGEALVAGWTHRASLHAWRAAWAVNSRYASALYAASVPYIVWEATTARDELRAIDLRGVRRNGNGSGMGAFVHRTLLPLGERLEGAIYRRAAVLTAMSEYTRAAMIARHGLDPDRVEVLTHPPGLAFLAALHERSRTSTLADPGASQSPRLLFVGRVTDPRKNATLLLDAYRKLKYENPAASLTIVGPYTESWRRSLGTDVDALGVRLMGRVSVGELAEAYLSHHLLIVPSLQEGFGIVVAEALHAGLPVVATRCGGPEAVLVASGAGVIVDHAPESIVRGASIVLASPDAWVARHTSALRYAQKELSFDRFATRVAELTARVAPELASHLGHAEHAIS
ncbi:MAG TPA: glycosyltransferase family 4 protein [Vicinamibacterales bacterium]|nr:glycosyltransferase family 4 protein [Vicinamibacterales bacterium]